MAEYSWVKNPAATIKQTIDMTGYVKTLVRQGYSQASLVFRFKADAGITVSCTVTAGGLFTFMISGGTLGRVYLVAAEVSAPSGDLRVEAASVRVREDATTTGGTVVLPPSGGTLNALSIDGGALSIDGGSLTLP